MKERIARLQSLLKAKNLDGFVSLDQPINQYLAGFVGTTSAVAVTQDDALFLCDFRYTEQAGDMVREMRIEEASGHLAVRAGEALKAMGCGRIGFEPESMAYAEFMKVAEGFGGELVPDGDLVTPLRMIKSRDEAETIRAASALAEGVLADIVEELRTGVTEQELAARFIYEFQRRGAKGPSFDPIVLFGARSSLPHGVPSDRPLRAGDVVLLDFGCRYGGYCSDLTRTYAFGSISGAWFDEVYHLTLTAQTRALDSIRPGMSGKDVDAVARDIIAAAGHGRHFGHGLGHGVGIEIHEAPRLNKESETILEPGMVVTVEPGIYIPGQGGVRIEDLVLVTESGCELLSDTPKALRILTP